MALSFADTLHHMIDLLPWREESHKIDAHDAITAELQPADAGAHSDKAAAESPTELPAANGGTGTAGKAEKA